LATASTPPLPPDPLRLRRRLGLQGGGFALLLLVAFSGSLYWAVAQQRVDDQRSELRQLAASAAAQLPLVLHETREAAGERKFKGGVRLVTPPGYEGLRVQWFDEAERLLSDQGGLAIPSAGAASWRAEPDGSGARWHRWPGGKTLWLPVETHGGPGRVRIGFVKVALSDQAAQRDLARLRRGLLLGGVVTILAALLVGRRMLAGAFAPLQSQVEALRRFSADASHELRHPLTVLRTLLATVPEPSREGGPFPWRELDRQVRSMAGLLEDLLALARYDQGGAAGANHLEVSRDFDLLELLEDLLRHFAIPAAQRGIQLRLTPSPMEHQQPIRGQPEALQRLFANLLDNAIRHSPTGGTVAIRVLAGGRRRLRVEVEDGGPGIGPQERQWVFERFWRGRDQGGHGGLGLAIARAIARRHGGELGLGESRPGCCVLVVDLPGL
jgi:signal transduction histidine kinase